MSNEAAKTCILKRKYVTIIYRRDWEETRLVVCYLFLHQHVYIEK